MGDWAGSRPPRRPRFECFSVGLLASTAAPDRVSKFGFRSGRSEKGSAEGRKEGLDCARGRALTVSSAEGRGGSLRGLVRRPGP